MRHKFSDEKKKGMYVSQTSQDCRGLVPRLGSEGQYLYSPLCIPLLRLLIT